MADGSRHSMRIVAEDSYSVTPDSPVFDMVRHTSTTLGLSKDSIQSEELRDDRQIADFRHGARQVGGDIGFELSYGTFDAILEATLGGTWESNVLKAGTMRRFFTIERYFADLLAADNPFHRFVGVEFNTMALQINANAMITGTFGVLGRDMVTDTAILPGATYNAPTTTSPLDSFTGELKESGAVIAVVTEIALNVENGLDPRFVVGSKVSIKPSIGRSNVTGTVTAYFENSSLINKFINEDESSVSIDLPDKAGNVLNITLPRIKYSGGQPDVSGEGPITLAMPFQALLDSTTGTNIILTRVPA